MISNIWLINLGESENYDKINIHANDEWAFQSSCQNGHIEIARWLINLGESKNYNKINIHAGNEYAFYWSCVNGYIEIANWLIHLGESQGYNKIDALYQSTNIVKN